MEKKSLHEQKLEAQRKLCKDKGLPMFAHSSCVNCNKSWTEKLSLEEAGSRHVMACPFCGWSWCD